MHEMGVWGLTVGFHVNAAQRFLWSADFIKSKA